MDRAFQEAQALEAAGERAAARDAYVAILTDDPTHLGSLTNLGTLLTYSGFKRAGRLAYAQAVASHPQHLRARTNLAAALLDEGDPAAALEQYEAALAIDPRSIDAHQGLALLNARNGAWERARAHARIGFAAHPIRRAPERGGAPRTPVLLLLSALGGNVDTERIIDAERFACDVLVAEFYEPQMQVAAYPVIFNAIGDAERCSEALAGALRFIETRRERVLNPPAAVLESSRARNADRMATIPGLRTARTVEIGRAELAATSLAFPILLRSPGFHTGEYFERVERREDLPAVLTALPGDRILAIEYLDTRGPDGFFRKYRVLIVGDRLYPIHLAHSQEWKVHYFSARATEDREERAFLTDMNAALGARAITALDRVRRTLGLDYGGIDFTIDAEGVVVLFEANATMNLFAPGPDAAPERTRAFETVRAAVSALLVARSSGTP
ncbi:MAG: tetratricopeptide repeat protein [Candidatus Eremiobacteraeota bacterium]|nr:hypothetical protein [Candidatus Eremiobacteraeota bacterium]NNM92579.1 tetratricopeptide repeat protein [Candidatus Eremiobacteraeota bacterium]